MLEYDPNLPQEFSKSPKRNSSVSLFIALLVAAFLLSAFPSRPGSKAPTGDKVAATQQAKAPHAKPRQPPG
jgi:hypothetical protein